MSSPLATAPDAISIAAKQYADHGMDFSRDLFNYLRFGIVAAAGDRLLLAREIRRDRPGEWVKPGDGDAYYVHYATGEDALLWFLRQAERPLKWVCWYRQLKFGPKSRLRTYSMERLRRKINGQHNT